MVKNDLKKSFSAGDILKNWKESDEKTKVMPSPVDIMFTNIMNYPDTNTIKIYCVRKHKGNVRSYPYRGRPYLKILIYTI